MGIHLSERIHRSGTQRIYALVHAARLSTSANAVRMVRLESESVGGSEEARRDRDHGDHHYITLRQKKLGLLLPR